MQMLPKIEIKIADDSVPVSEALLLDCRASLQKLRLSVSGAATAAMLLCGVSLLADMTSGGMLAKVVFAATLLMFLALRRWEKKGLAQSMQSVAPVPDEYCAEIAALANISEPARKYCGAVRAQGREFIQAEYEALREAAHRLIAPAAGRKALYGK